MSKDFAETIKIRQALAEEATAIRDLTRAAYEKWIPVIGREPLPMVADYERALVEHRIDLLFANERLIGLIETVEKGAHLLIVNVAVAPAHQGRGNGGRLLRHAEALAASLGLKELRLYTNEKFAANIALYRRFGYQRERDEPFMGGLTVHMSKRLVAA
jgi:ribosomal protein S18 acetylase RimI-like enzyme